MNNTENIEREIDNLKSLIPSGFFFNSKPDWKSVWEQIKKINKIFKDVRYPQKEDRQKAWDDFQALITEVKQLQEKEKEEWENKKAESERLRDRIINQADNATLPSGLGEVILALTTGGISTIINDIMGPFDERKADLQNASKQLRKGWEMLEQYKNEMLAKDKRDAYKALNDAKENLDNEWDDYKRERQNAFNSYIREKEQRREERRERIETNINKLEERRTRLNEILAHKESHLDDLRRKLSDAWSDDYRDRISGWIYEEESSINDIQDKLKDVENWLYEARSKLH